nr:hypothetical protein [Tanacetum cinerariifolium]
MNQDSYNSNSLGFDQPQPPQSSVIHQPPQELCIQEMEDLKQQYLDELKRLSNLEYHDGIKISELKENFNGMSIEIQKKGKASATGADYTSAITPDEPVLSTEEPNNSLCMGDEHLDTILATESDEFIKSSVENHIPIPSESEGIPEHMSDVPSHDNSPPLDVLKDQFKDFSESNEEFSLTDDDSFSFDKINYVEASPLDYELVSSEVMEIVIPEVGGIDADILLTIKDDILRENLLNIKSSSTYLNSLLEETNNFNNSLPEFTIFSKVLFDAEYESDSSVDQSCFNKDILEKIVSKPLCEEEIIPMKSLRTHDSSLPISSKIDSLLDEFADELTLLKSISPGINETDCDFEEGIRLIEKLFTTVAEKRAKDGEAVSASFISSNVFYTYPKTYLNLSPQTIVQQIRIQGL